jgi:EAL domain-containing protein (putative c-di-GMP-specific phosphodiesterase class I)
VSVDDFGTGDSAIAYLKRFPLDTLKVDQSFIAGALTDPRRRGHHFGDDSHGPPAAPARGGEGVEEQSQVDMLNALECEEVQGFFFSRPLPADAFRDLLASHRTARVLPSPWSTAGGNHEVSR